MPAVASMTRGRLRSRDEEAEKLIARMSDGDVSAMGELYELIQSDVFAYALSKTGCRENAEDVAQDTFVSVWKHAKQYNPMGKPLAWIFTIEINIIRKQFNKSRRVVSLDESIETEVEEECFTESIVNNDFLRRVLALLSEEEREVISLHIVSGLKHREIAKLLEKPISTVLSKYNRAIKKLQAQITDGED